MKNALDIIRRFEGRVLHTYDDADPHTRRILPGMPVKGTLSIGYGHTRNVRAGQTCTELEAELWLAEDLAETSRVRQWRDVPAGYQLAALESLAYNIPAAFGRSTGLRHALDSGSYGDVPAEIQRWNPVTVKLTAGTKQKRVEPGLTKRRAIEAALFELEHSISRMKHGEPSSLQTCLWLAGHDPGPIDGFRGPQTRAAKKAFLLQTAPGALTHSSALQLLAAQLRADWGLV